MNDYRAINPWRGVSAVAFVAAATIIAVAFGIMAVLVLNRDRH